LFLRKKANWFSKKVPSPFENKKEFLGAAAAPEQENQNHS
jgi:hypothetical protein